MLQEDAIQAQPETATAMPSRRFLPAEVLVVDDDEAVRELILAYFLQHGLRVAGATDGRAAIAALERSQGRYEMVVTDLSLPGAGGLAVLQAARQANASCYVVIVTGYASLDSAIAAVRLGAYDYLTKPFALGQLDVILQRIADRRSLEHENRSLLHGDAARGGGACAGQATLADVAERLARLEAAVSRLALHTRAIAPAEPSDRR
jgi:DNA-binding NtrC family response regulator